jgi:hypothetical protein
MRSPAPEPARFGSLRIVVSSVRVRSAIGIARGAVAVDPKPSSDSRIAWSNERLHRRPSRARSGREASAQTGAGVVPAFRVEAGERVLGMLGAARAAGQAASTAAERRPP